MIAPVFCVLVTVLTHFALAKYGFEWMHSDYALIPLTAEDFLEGKFSAYVFNMEYAGTSLQVLRALWVKLWLFLQFSPIEATEPGLSTSRIDAHNLFTYVVCPALLSVSSYFVTRAYVSKSAALFTGIVMAVGLDFLIKQYGNDAYVAYLILGSILLIWKSKVANPLWGLDPLRLLGAGVLCGLAIYTSRISILFIAVFLLPWKASLVAIRQLGTAGNSAKRSERWAFFTGVFFLSLWGYLEVFGSNLGQFRGRDVKLHAHPNLKIAVLFLGATLLLMNRDWFIKNLKTISSRGAVFTIGFLVGCWPEWIHALSVKRISNGGSGGNATLAESFRALGLLPSALTEILTATTDSLQTPNILAQGSFALVVLAVFSMTKTFREDRTRFLPILLLASLAILAFCRIRTYTFASARYLLPILPVIWVALGCLWDRSEKRGKYAMAGTILLFSLHSLHQLAGRSERIDLVKAHPMRTHGELLVKSFREVNVRVVVSDEYWWNSNNLSWLASRNPVFEPPAGPGLRTGEGEKIIHNDQKIGFLVTDSSNKLVAATGLISAWETEWEVKKIGAFGNSVLYVGVRKPLKALDNSTTPQEEYL